MFGIFKKETVSDKIETQNYPKEVLEIHNEFNTAADRLLKEAKEYAKSFDKNLYGYDGNSFSPEDEKQIQDFIAGANSKYVQAKVIQAQIKLSIHYMNNTNDADTLYFIGKQVKELEQQLKNLENEK